MSGGAVDGCPVSSATPQRPTAHTTNSPPPAARQSLKTTAADERLETGRRPQWWVRAASPVFTGIPVPATARRSGFKDSGCHSSPRAGDSRLRRGPHRRHPRRTRLSPLCRSPARASISREPDGGRPEGWRRPEETPCSTPFPAGDGRGRRAAVLTPEGRPAGRFGAEPGRPGLPRLTVWSISGIVI